MAQAGDALAPESIAGLVERLPVGLDLPHRFFG
jgi:hypothetical protein